VSAAAPEPLVEERVRFGGGIPVAVNALLQQAAANAHDFAASERALLAALRRLDPDDQVGASVLSDLTDALEQP
jgi:hypothetical protein